MSATETGQTADPFPSKGQVAVSRKDDVESSAAGGSNGDLGDGEQAPVINFKTLTWW